jgi:glycosyltransferase involved in cell wall biosynthesis
VPVIATASEGAREIIEPNQTGRLVPIGDIEAMANEIIRLLEDVDERERLARNAQNAARERFSLQRMVDETEKVYAKATGQ